VFACLESAACWRRTFFLAAEFSPALLPRTLIVWFFWVHACKALGLACLSPNFCKELLGIQLRIVNHIISVSISNCNMLQRMFPLVFRKKTSPGLVYSHPWIASLLQQRGGKQKTCPGSFTGKLSIIWSNTDKNGNGWGTYWEAWRRGAAEETARSAQTALRPWRDGETQNFSRAEIMFKQRDLTSQW